MATIFPFYQKAVLKGRGLYPVILGQLLEQVVPGTFAVLNL